MKMTACMLDRKILLRICLMAFLTSMPKIYAVEGYKDFPYYFVVCSLILVLVHFLKSNKSDHWLVDCAALAVFFLLFGNFGLSSLSWVLWIFLVGSVLLRRKTNYKNFRLVTTNIIIFVTLFSAVELPLRLPESSDAHPNINRGIVSNSKSFVTLSEKDYFIKALEQSRQSSSFFSPNEEFLIVMKEQIKSSNDLVFLDDFPGSYITIEAGRRVTVGSSGMRQKRVLVFGGSTVFCAEVPNSMTLPSQLQKIVLGNKFDVDVVNYGVPGIRIENQLKILETINELGPDDIVVFYDGVNDLNTIFRLGLESKNSLIPLGGAKWILGWLDMNSLLARFLISGYIDSKSLGNEFLENQVEDLVTERWISNDQLARAYSESRGAKFVHILQPNWVTYKGGVEATRDSNRWEDMKVIENYFEKYATPDSEIENFAKVLDGLSTNPYIDWAHLDEVGNKKIAEEMFKVLEPLLKDQFK